MKKLVITLSSIALLFASCAIFTSCSEHDIWADGCPYKWAVTDNDMLYSPDKSMTVEEYKDKLCGHVWELVEMRDISSDLLSYSDRKTFDGMDGWGGRYLYFTENECVDFCHNLINPAPEVRYIYTKAPVEIGNDGNMVSFNVPGLRCVVMGVLKDGRLEIAESSPRYAIDDNGERLDYNQIINYTYSYCVYELCDDIDMDEVIAKGMTQEEFRKMFLEGSNPQ